ncbi:alginate lyase family protein [Dyadobacter psychrotolerans]|uniref:Alginate lyase domain-containing protein n=1 Tax=Dyadobacter psychrotolerans TaxID=2541721 RepID=A0A4R5DQL8_9BACT|nr:alginate lyase family protein [Dyadobacter psychrotolerans]TDE14544.1 hypothetical protein E0F88_15220 [Dyadobacter psychrotolerans]
MKNNICLLLFFIISFSAAAQFTHPGMLNNSADFKFLKAKIKAGQEPWKSAWETLRKSPEAQLTWKAKPTKVIVVGFYSKPDVGGTDFRKDGDAAYTAAIQYIVTGDKAFAEKSIEIINGWSYSLDSVTDGNKKLLVGMVGIKFLNAAELIKHTYKGWAKKDQQAFEKMVINIWYPLLKDFMPGYNGNWDAAIAQTVMCIGVYMDRSDIFNLAYNQILNGESNGAIDNYFNEGGQCQESGRDQGHAQMGLGFLATVCEIAWKQGRDLYSAYQNRLALGYEYTAKYMLGEDVKYEKYTTFQGKKVFGDSISSIGRGKFSPIYERPYHHYHDRMKMEMPYTKKALDKTRPEAYNSGYMPWATLLTAAYPGK